ncbi:adenosylhomocysteinase [Weissella oryzae SG25]|uniref:Adenosylhomocysteinase n=1 Tax=Weissella oryzae (strain DSM 25784 / JCM 18191 / LMG 30913 / SG25) TaxID=1329250 RepID=A0A069D2G9_WEIOS|nr:NUDIX hydrolase [Weissella oryzae]GAK31626.1 adenosylhomocysteinase [Weissella oryzae SG25]
MTNDDLQSLLVNYQPQSEQEQADYPFFLKAAQDKQSLTRNSLAHFTASAFVLNQAHDHVLAVFHKIYQSWGWLGGHADGNPDLLAVAKKELYEESGLVAVRPLQTTPISLEMITVAAHRHRSRGYVSAHLHLNATFLFEADDSNSLKLNADETAGIAWLSLEEFLTKTTEPEMQVIYTKIIERIKNN